MATAQGSYRDLRCIEETVWGTTPDTPTFISVRNTGGAGLKLARTSLVSGEMRSDRQIPTMRLGNNQGSLEFPFEFSYGGELEALMEAALFSVDKVAAYTLTGLTVTIAASAKTFTRSTGSWVTDGVIVGDNITFSGCVDAGNNHTFVVSAVEALIVTCATATGLEDETADTGVGATTDRMVMKSGTTARYFSFEDAQTDIDIYQVATGMMPNTFSLTIAPDQIVTGSFGFLGKTLGATTGSTAATAVTPAGTNDPFDSYTGSILENGSEVAVITGLTLNLSNGLEAKFPLFDADAHHVAIGRCNITGSVSMWMENGTYINKFVNETSTSLKWTLTDPDGNGYIFYLPSVKYTDAGKNVTENEVVVTLPFQALYDSTEACTLRVDKCPVAS